MNFPKVGEIWVSWDNDGGEIAIEKADPLTNNIEYRYRQGWAPWTIGCLGGSYIPIFWHQYRRLGDTG